MLIAAAVCPHPPLLVPDIAQSAAGVLEPLRAACDHAVSVIAAAGADELVVVGTGPRTRDHGRDAGGDFTGYGVDVQVGPPTGTLPLSLTMGRWLAERGGARPSRYVEVAVDTPPEECLVRGAELAARAPRVAVLAMGDGSARRTEHSPGYIDERAVPFDASVAAALGAADLDAVAALDPLLAHEVMAAGRAAWQVLAGAADGAGLSGELLAHEAPYGVGYFAAVWNR